MVASISEKNYQPKITQDCKIDISDFRMTWFFCSTLNFDAGDEMYEISEKYGNETQSRWN